MGRVLKQLPDGIMICRTEPWHVEDLATLQCAVFPSLTQEARFTPSQYLAHREVFLEGQFVALDGDQVIGATTTIRTDFDFANPVHTFMEASGNGWLTTHEPAGEWLYGLDVGVHPDHRGRGIGRALYAVRQELVWELGLSGQLSVGMMSGYGSVKETMSAQEYFAELVAGRVNDPTLSMQQRIGFEIRHLIPGYLEDPVCDNYGVLIVLPASRDVTGAVRPNA